MVSKNKCAFCLGRNPHCPICFGADEYHGRLSIGNVEADRIIMETKVKNLIIAMDVALERAKSRMIVAKQYVERSRKSLSR